MFAEIARLGEFPLVMNRRYLGWDSSRLRRAGMWASPRVLAGLLMTFLLAALSNSAQGLQVGDFRYAIEIAEVTITGYSGSGGHVVIPDTIEGMPVTRIGQRAFRRRVGLTTLEMGSQVVEIGVDAFLECSDLERVTIPDAVGVIGDGAFRECVSLLEVVGGGGVVSIGDGAFRECVSLLEVVGGSGVVSIGDLAFLGCQRLSEFEMGRNLQHIGHAAFEGCASLVSIHLPDSVTSIGSDAFRGCSNITSFVMSQGIEAIPDGMFYECRSLPDIDIPSGVTEIGTAAFFRCVSLTEMVIPDGVDRINGLLFAECVNLRSVGLSSKILSIESFAFAYCHSLVSLELPEGLRSIGGQAFVECRSLTEIVFPESLEVVGRAAFNSCSGLRFVKIPAALRDIGIGFFSCSSIEYFEVATLNSSYSSRDGVLFNADGTVLLNYPAAKVGAYSIPDNVVEIGWVDGIDGLTAVFIPAGVLVGPGRSFISCPALVSINVDPANPVYSSLDGVLFNKDGTELLKFPGGKPGDYTIPDNCPSVASSAFSGCRFLEEVFVPTGVMTIGDRAFGNCSSLLSVKVDESNANYSSVDGVFCSKDGTTLIQFPGGREGSYEVPGRVQKIEPWTFYGCRWLKKIVWRPELVSIPGYAFADCASLETIVIPEGVSSIGGNAFDNCDSLQTITFPASVIELGNYPFYHCERFVGAYFAGAPPRPRSLRFLQPEKITVFHLPDIEGWGDEYAGHPTAVWPPSPRTDDDSFGVEGGAFGFNVSWAGDREVVIEAADNVVDPVWEEKATMTLSDGEAYFSDPAWAEHPGRFYRVRGL